MKGGIMKCYNFMCGNHDADCINNCSNMCVYVDECESRKRYNRIIDKMNRSKFKYPIKLELGEQFLNERKKYYGRNR
jgi:hypothetical protein